MKRMQDFKRSGEGQITHLARRKRQTAPTSAQRDLLASSFTIPIMNLMNTMSVFQQDIVANQAMISRRPLSS